MKSRFVRGLAALTLLAAAAYVWAAPIGTRGMAEANAANQEIAIFAGGCFWCVESDFDRIPGVISTTSGYIGGKTDNPTYQQVSYEDTGHYEAVKVVYDPKVVSYQRLVSYFWTTIDPLDTGGQFCDRGDSYKTAIFATSDEQLKIASAAKMTLQESKRLGDAPIATRVLAAPMFWDGEDYHQDYYRKNPTRYKIYRYGCGRDARLKALWGDDARGGKPQS